MMYRIVIMALCAGWLGTAVAQVSQAPPDTGPKTPAFNFPPLPADAPHPAADPHDLQGSWVHEGMPARLLKTDAGDGLPYLPATRAIVEHRRAEDARGTPMINPSSLCRPPGLLWDFELNFPFLIVQSPHEVVFLFEEFHAVWRIFLDPSPTHAIVPSYEGYSVGHWEGDTLVVRTVGVRPDTWLDIAGSPHSADAVFVHRIRKMPGDTLQIRLTVTDPAMYSQPWTITRTMNWRPDMWQLGEYNCEQATGSIQDAERFHVYADPSK